MHNLGEDVRKQISRVRHHSNLSCSHNLGEEARQQTSGARQYPTQSCSYILGEEKWSKKTIDVCGSWHNDTQSANLCVWGSIRSAASCQLCYCKRDLRQAEFQVAGQRECLGARASRSASVSECECLGVRVSQSALDFFCCIGSRSSESSAEAVASCDMPSFSSSCVSAAGCPLSGIQDVQDLLRGSRVHENTLPSKN